MATAETIVEMQPRVPFGVILCFKLLARKMPCSK